MFNNLINDIKNKITDKVNTIKEENNYYKELIEKTTIINNLFPIPSLNQPVPIHKVTTITTESPDINKDKAQTIASLIPIDETYLEVIYTKEIKTSKEYYLIPTNKYLWIISNNTYGIYNYQNLNCKIIKKNLMSKTILLNNILLEASGSDTKINSLISILTNNEYREKVILEKTKYLCGIIPIYQNINTIYSGISIDNNQTIVFHTKTNNYKCHINDISYQEILLDNSVAFSNKNNTTNKLTTYQNSCSTINVRIVLKNNQTINIPILEPNTFNTKYQRNDSIFQNNINFAYEIINKIKEITPNNY